MRPMLRHRRRGDRGARCVVSCGGRHTRVRYGGCAERDQQRHNLETQTLAMRQELERCVGKGGAGFLRTAGEDVSACSLHAVIAASSVPCISTCPDGRQCAGIGRSKMQSAKWLGSGHGCACKKGRRRSETYLPSSALTLAPRARSHLPTPRPFRALRPASITQKRAFGSRFAARSHP